MIVLGENAKTESENASMEGEQPPVLPPPYSRPESSETTSTTYIRTDAANLNAPEAYSPTASPSTSSQGTLPGATAPPIQPCNYLSVSRTHENIKGPFVVDPTLRIPPTLLPPLTEDEAAEGIGEAARRNLRLECKHAWIDSEVWVVNGVKNHGGTVRPDSEGLGTGSDGQAVEAFGVGDVKRLPETPQEAGVGSGTKPVRIDISGTHAGMKVKLRCEDGLTIRLNATSRHSNLAIYLPRNFHGPFRYKSTRSNFKASPALTSHITTFSDIDGLRQCFIGNYSQSSRSAEQGDWTGKVEDWNGDMLTIEAIHSNVKLYWIDEESVTGPRIGGGGSFFLKLFGWNS